MASLARRSLVLPSSPEAFEPPKRGDIAGLWDLFLRDKAEVSRDNYRFDLACFAKFVAAAPMDALGRLLASKGPEANAVVVGYVGYLREAKFFRKGEEESGAPVQVGYAPATINRRIYALRAVVKLARLCGHVEWELDVPLRKAEPVRDTRGPQPEGYGRILGTIEQAIVESRAAYEDAGHDDRDRMRTELEIALRDLVIVRLLHDSGLRRAETTRIEWPLGVILDDDRKVLVLGKGRTATQWVTVSAECRDAIRAYLQVRGSKRGYLLKGTHPKYPDRRLNKATVNRRVAYWSALADANTTPHGLRHTACTSVLDETGGDYRTAANWSRHKDPASLRRYDDARRQDAKRLTDIIADPSNARPHEE